MKTLALALALAIAHAATIPAAAADLADVTARGTLRVIVMPLSATDEFFPVPPGPRPGFDREVLDGFVGLHRIKLVVVPVEGWDNLVPALLQGRGDLIAGRFTVTDARLKQIAFTSEVFPTRNVVMTRRPHARVQTLEALRQEKVGTIKGSSMAEAVRAVVPAPNVDDSFPPGGLPAALTAGKVSAIVLGIESAIAAQREDAQIELGAFVGPPGSLAYGVRKEDTALLKALNEYIDNVRRTPTWSRLVVEYFGSSAPEILRKARAN
ncbi:MAG TPA: transporter substrate-binding domain-containing protein [Vicinamibacteria bacterium]|nr:transporter substrate-binding domain-containing protein [Vicinamibacteria bacterium]